MDKPNILYEYPTKAWQFIDLANDPYEQQDWSNRNPVEALALAERMIQRLQERHVSFPLNATKGKEILPDLTPLRKIAAKPPTP